MVSGQIRSISGEVKVNSEEIKVISRDFGVVRGYNISNIFCITKLRIIM